MSSPEDIPEDKAESYPCECGGNIVVKDGWCECDTCDFRMPVTVRQHVQQKVRKGLAPLLPGRWRVSNGTLCCGTLRIARMDYDTDPSAAFKKEIEDVIVNCLNMDWEMREAVVDAFAAPWKDCAAAAEIRKRLMNWHAGQVKTDALSALDKGLAAYVLYLESMIS